MALTESHMLPLGTRAPFFSLRNVTNEKNQNLDELSGTDGTLIIFMCNHCPYVIHLLDHLILSIIDFSKKSISTIAISSNNISTHPQDSPKEMKKMALKKNFSFPYLFDESQEVAHSYQAACTPDFYLFDANKKLVYRGRYDDSRPGNNIPVSGNDLRKAADLMLLKRKPIAYQKPSIGCSIKWHSGNSLQSKIKN